MRDEVVLPRPLHANALLRSLAGLAPPVDLATEGWAIHGNVWPSM